MRWTIGFLYLATLAVQAQPASQTESVTVTGARSRQVLDQFVQSFAAPARMTGKLARWEDGVCPVTVGLAPKFTAFVTQHVKEIATKIGAPVNARDRCKPNIEIVFTTAPQKLLDNVRKRQPTYLGYADSSAQMDELAKVTHPIQSWYTTATKDLRGNVQVDSSKVVGAGIAVDVPCDLCASGRMTLNYAASAGAVTGSRLGDGMRSTLYHVIVVANPNQLGNYEIGALADYIAMLSLTQLSALDTCQQLPSIVNLLAPGCSNPVQSLTENDLGYLRGLYKMGAERTARSQQNEIAYQMQQTQDGK